MTKTYKDRVSFISRLERKYAKKMQLRSQARRRDIKNALRGMKGRRSDIEDARTESLDGIFRHSTKVAHF